MEGSVEERAREGKRRSEREHGRRGGRKEEEKAWLR
jgi:hypothetical protein